MGTLLNIAGGIGMLVLPIYLLDMLLLVTVGITLTDGPQQLPTAAEFLGGVVVGIVLFEVGSRVTLDVGTIDLIDGVVYFARKNIGSPNAKLVCSEFCDDYDSRLDREDEQQRVTGYELYDSALHIRVAAGSSSVSSPEACYAEAVEALIHTVRVNGDEFAEMGFETVNGDDLAEIGVETIGVNVQDAHPDDTIVADGFTIPVDFGKKAGMKILKNIWESGESGIEEILEMVERNDPTSELRGEDGPPRVKKRR